MFCRTGPRTVRTSCDPGAAHTACRTPLVPAHGADAATVHSPDTRGLERVARVIKLGSGRKQSERQTGSSIWLLSLTNSESTAPLSMESSRQGCWSGLPVSTPGDLPDNPGIEPASLVSPARARGLSTPSTT